mgnify:CR=1 FL=1
MDSLMAKAGNVMDQVQALLDSMNQVMGNPDFQKNFLQMAVNIRDMTAHMDGLVAAMEQTMRENQATSRACSRISTRLLLASTAR